MKVLLVIPSKMKHGVDDLVSADRHPTMDYFALSKELRDRGATVDFLDNTAVKASRLPNDLSLAILAAKVARHYDAVFTNSESVSIPLSFFFRFFDKRPRHVTIAHKLTTGKKAVFFRRLKVQSDIDTLFVYAETQRRFGADVLGISEEKLKLISFHADSDFFRPLPAIATVPGQFCSAGLEWRDYPTLVETARQLPDCTFKIAAASPWSKHKNELDGHQLPSNVSARRYEYGELRELYAQSVATIVPLYENDFQAGVTTILETMAVGRPVIATRTSGQKDVIIEGDTGFYVPPGEPSALKKAVSVLNSDPELCSAMGARGRQWLLQNASLTKWASTIAQDIVCVEASLA